MDAGLDATVGDAVHGLAIVALVFLDGFRHLRIVYAVDLARVEAQIGQRLLQGLHRARGAGIRR